MKKRDSIKAWHFVGKTLRDGSRIPRNGVWLKYSGAIEICQAGYHASREPFDALTYAPGDTLCLVECRGAVIEQADKLVCSERRIIARMDASELLRYYTRMQAVSCVENCDLPDVVLDWLMTGDKEIQAAALSAAWSAAESAAWSAALSAMGQDFNSLVYYYFADFI